VYLATLNTVIKTKCRHEVTLFNGFHFDSNPCPSLHLLPILSLSPKVVAEETGMPEADAERLCERLRVHMEVGYLYARAKHNDQLRSNTLWLNFF